MRVEPTLRGCTTNPFPVKKPSVRAGSKEPSVTLDSADSFVSFGSALLCELFELRQFGPCASSDNHLANSDNKGSLLELR